MERQLYGSGFANAYNQHLAGFAEAVAPQLLDFYVSTPIGQRERSILDVCCGTGQTALYFLERGYHVTGIDVSPHMLGYARTNTSRYIASAQARFVECDASDFTLDQRFGLACSTFDALNHLDSEDRLRRCFECVYAVLLPDGYFLFDLNTRLGLSEWQYVQGSVGAAANEIVIRGGYDDQSDKAFMSFSGTTTADNGQLEPFSETIFETGFDLEMVRNALLDIGWRQVHFAHQHALHVPLAAPEAEEKVFVVAHK